MPNDDEAIHYEVVVTERAEAQLESAYLWMLRYGLPVADAWINGITRSIQSLSRFPQKFPIVGNAESLGYITRKMIHGSTSSRYRILYRIIEQEDGSIPTVYILSIEHASRPFEPGRE